MQNFVKISISLLTTTGVYLFGGLDIALQTLLLFIALDYITGLMKSYKSKTLNSKVGLKGILKKLGILCMVALACGIDRMSGETGLVRTLIIYYLVSNEGLSIIENLGEMGLLVPEIIKDKLEQLKGSGTHESK